MTLLPLRLLPLPPLLLRLLPPPPPLLQCCCCCLLIPSSYAAPKARPHCHWCRLVLLDTQDCNVTVLSLIATWPTF